MEVIEQARRYLNAIPPAVSGQNGHDQTFAVACILVNGFALPKADAWGLMTEYSARCVPPWTEREIDHKLTDAERVPHEKPRGHLIRHGIRHTYRNPSAPKPAPVSAPAPQQPKPEAKRYNLEESSAVPGPMQDGARALLRAAFKSGDGIRIAMARTNEEGREVPKDSGIVLSLEEWLKKLDREKGNPNGFLSTSDRNGIFISVNPLKVGGSKDSDVTAYRHCLLEFDEISIQEQWSLIAQSRIPAVAVLYSGGRSLHAWVRIDAKDRTEYEQRVKLLYGHFAEYKPDEKNRNPSRFSRLPNCMRFDKRQELLALNIGAESFLAWQVEHELEELGQEIRVSDMLAFVPSEDPSMVLGPKRWLCKGGSCFIIGPSGMGKSSLEMQMAILWAMGRPAFGIPPVKPLRSLIIQAENDLGDLSEMFQGVWVGMKFGDNPGLIRQVHENLIVRRISSKTGPDFCLAARRLVDKYKPDLCWLDPTLAFLGDDISKQSVCSQFFRNGLSPIAEATGVIWMILHHTGKPSKDHKSKSGWTLSDYSYDGLGSSDLTNWARAVMILRQFDENRFELMLAKRGTRAGARDTQNNFTTSVWLKKSVGMIFWDQVDAPSEEEIETVKKQRSIRAGRKSAVERFDFEKFLSTLKHEYLSATQLVERARKFSKLSDGTCWKTILPELKKKMKFDQESERFTVE